MPALGKNGTTSSLYDDKKVEKPVKNNRINIQLVISDDRTKKILEFLKLHYNHTSNTKLIRFLLDDCYNNLNNK